MAEKLTPRSLGFGGYLRSAGAVFAKDLRCEFRTRQSLSAVILFAVTSTVAVTFTLGAWAGKSDISAALLWLVIYFSAMSGLSRSFVREEETFTSDTLRLAARPNSVYLGKLIFNFALIVAIEVVTVPLFALLSGCFVREWAAFAVLFAVGGLGLSAGATIAAAMVARATTRGALYAVICFPLLVPVLSAAIHGTGITMGTQAVFSAWSDIRILVSYCGVVITASLMLFRCVWEN